MVSSTTQPPDLNARLRLAFRSHRAGELDRAIAIYRELLPHFTANPQFLYLLGSAECQRGHPEEGADLLKESLQMDPANVEAHMSLGNALQEMKRFDEALAAYEQAVRLGPGYAAAHFNRAHVLADLGRLDEALAGYDRAIELSPDDAEAYINRGNVLGELGRAADALASFELAIGLSPDDAEAHINRGNVLRDLGRLDDALASYDRACQLRPDYAEAHSNRGHVLADLGRTDEALASYDHAIRLGPQSAEAHFNRGHLLADLGRLDEALAGYDRAIELKPDYAEAYGNKSMLKLAKGDYLEGWKLYEWRWKGTHLKNSFRTFPQPAWTGESPIAGKTLLVHAEQGFGDVIQFCRYVPMIEKLGAGVVLEVPGCLVSLVSTLGCNPRVVEKGARLPPFDIHCPLMSLPLAFRTTLETIPGDVPYLHDDERKSAYWRQRLGPSNGLRVGLVWSTGHDERRRRIAEQKRRDIPLRDLESLNIEGVGFFSLQVGSAAVSQLRSLESAGWRGPRIVDCTDEIRDFSDTAALIGNLDLVISVCTSVAHLAGAMGKRTWVLLHRTADWRWLLDRSDSPWYPTVTLFRQASFGDWTDVVAEVREKLIELADAHRHSSGVRMQQSAAGQENAVGETAQRKSPAEAGPVSPALPNAGG